MSSLWNAGQLTPFLLPRFVLHASTHTLSYTHTHTHVGFYGLRGLSIGVMVFILYKLYVLLPYTYPTPKLSPHRRRCIYIFPQKTHSVWFISVLNYGDTENVLKNHLLLVIPMSYPCHYTNLCPHKPHKHAHTHTHTHTHTLSLSLSLSLSLTHTHIHTHIHVLSPSRTLLHCRISGDMLQLFWRSRWVRTHILQLLWSVFQIWNE